MDLPLGLLKYSLTILHFITLYATYFRDYPVVINHFFFVFLHMIHDFMECEQLRRHFFFLPIVIETLTPFQNCRLVAVIMIK